MEVLMEFKHMPMNGANYTNEDIKRLINEYNVQFIKLQFVDINGQVKNLAVPSEHIDRVLNNDIMLDGSSIKGFRDIETSDMFFYPDKNTFQIIPWQERDGKNSARLICDIYNADGTPFEGRHLLSRGQPRLHQGLFPRGDPDDPPEGKGGQHPGGGGHLPPKPLCPWRVLVPLPLRGDGLGGRGRREAVDHPPFLLRARERQGISQDPGEKPRLLRCPHRHRAESGVVWLPHSLTSQEDLLFHRHRLG